MAIFTFENVLPVLPPPLAKILIVDSLKLAAVEPVPYRTLHERFDDKPLNLTNASFQAVSPVLVLRLATISKSS
jgi:hypothetical protein